MRTFGGPGAHRVVARFADLYAAVGRPSIPPEQLLRALLVQVLYAGSALLPRYHASEAIYW
jgi:hypothetical protein